MFKKVTALCIAIILVLQLAPIMVSAAVISTTMNFSEFNLKPGNSRPISGLFDGTNWTQVGTNFASPGGWYTTGGGNYIGPAQIVTDDGYNALMYSEDSALATDRIFRQLNGSSDTTVPSSKVNTITYISFKLKVDPSSTPANGDYIHYWLSDDFNAPANGSDVATGLYYNGSAYQVETGMNSGSPQYVRTTVPFTKGDYYNFLICLNGNVSGSTDTTSVKMWPVGGIEPTGWQSSSSSGKYANYTRMLFECKGFKGAMLADFKQEVYNDTTTTNLTPVKAAENTFITSDSDIKSSSKTLADKQTALANAESAFTAASSYASPVALQSLRNRLIQFRNTVGALSTPPATPVSVTSVSMTTTPYVTDTADEIMLDASVLPVDASNQTITYSSDNESVATVDAKGLVRFAGAGGTANITATSADGGYTKTRAFTMNKTNVESVTIPTSLTISTFETAQLDPVIVPDNASVKTVSWESSNTNIVTVDSFGNVYGKSEGSANATVTADGGKQSVCAVTVQHVIPTTLTLNISSLGLDLVTNKTYDINETVGTQYATVKTVSWTSDDTAIATVSSAGVVTAKAVGTTTVRCKTTEGNLETTCSVVVLPTAPTVTLENNRDFSTDKLKIGDVITLKPIISPPEALPYVVSAPFTGSKADQVVNDNGRIAIVGIASNIQVTCTVNFTFTNITKAVSAYIYSDVNVLNGSPTFKIGSTAQSKLVDGTYTCTYTIKNTVGADTITPIFAIYDASGNLERAVMGTTETLAQDAIGTARTQSLGTISNSAGKVIKMFFWTSTANVTPLLHPFIFDSVVGKGIQ